MILSETLNLTRICQLQYVVVGPVQNWGYLRIEGWKSDLSQVFEMDDTFGLGGGITEFRAANKPLVVEDLNSANPFICMTMNTAILSVVTET